MIIVIDSIEIDVPLAWQGPAAYAKSLVNKFPFNEEQIDLIALLVLPLEKSWRCRDKQETFQLPNDLGLVRVLVAGGGGCGKTTIVMKILKPLLEVYFGHDGVQLAAPSNKAARLIKGKTVHNLVGLRANDSLKTYDLNLSKHQDRKKLDATVGKAGGLILDEFSQLQSVLFHAAALRTSAARMDRHQLNMSDYARPSQLFGKVSFLLLCGDHLQLPPVPKSASLLSTPEGGSNEHKAAISMFTNIPQVFLLDTAMRFTDPVLISILRKMRTKGGAKLTNEEWVALCNTKLDMDHPALEVTTLLENTHNWYHTCYLWNIVNLIAFVRVRTSAKLAKKTVFFCQAIDDPDKPLNADQFKDLLGVANLSTTQKLPGINMFSAGQRVRLMCAVLPPFAAPDSAGEIIDITFAEQLPDHLPAECLISMPKAIYVKIDDLSMEFLPPKPCHQHVIYNQ